MNSQLISFFLYVEDKFGKFITEVQDELNIPEEILKDILARQEFRDIFSGKHKQYKVILSNSKEVKKEEGCISKLKSGARKGELCGKKISASSDTKKYCGMHIKLETVAAVKDKQAEELDGPVFRLNRWNNFAFGDTGLILKSGTERQVIGKQLSDGSIVDLSTDDICLCKRRSLKFIARYSKKEEIFNNSDEEVNTSSTISHTSKIAL
jgi:hypothetical protein